MANNNLYLFKKYLWTHPREEWVSTKLLVYTIKDVSLI